MTATISQLQTILHPPVAPRCNRGDWAVVERELQTVLPADYKKFIEIYGAGIICGRLWINSPFDENQDANLIAQCRGITGLYADLRHQGVGKKTSLFGEPGGVLPLGSSEEGHMLNWRTVGAPDDWTISVWDVDCLEFREIKSTLTKFLLELFDGSSPLYDQHVFEWLKGQPPVFEPYP